MNDYEILVRRLEREKQARIEAENLSEEKFTSLYLVNQKLEKALIEQKISSKQLKARTQDLKELNILKEKLLKSNEELEHFAYITSHDLKAPLRAIERLSSWIEEDNKDCLSAESKENLTLLRKRVNRLSNLIDSILEYSRAGRVDLDIKVVDLDELLHGVIDSLNPPVNFNIIYPPPLPKFKTPEIPLCQVFINLISNSIKHHDKKDGKIEIGAKDLGKRFEFSVSDNGPGIEEIYFKKIFMIFQTLQSKDEMESTGIGLSIVKKIVESQGGTVTVESTLGKGTSFKFTWPKY